MSIRIQETDDGWVIEVTGKKTASAHPTHRMDDLIRTEGWVTHDDLSRAVQAERARCVAWAERLWFGDGFGAIRDAIRDGKPAPEKGA